MASSCDQPNCVLTKRRCEPPRTKPERTSSLLVREAIRRVRAFHDLSDNNPGKLRRREYAWANGFHRLYCRSVCSRRNGQLPFVSDDERRPRPDRRRQTHRFSDASQSPAREPAFAAALVELGVTEVYAIGGAQAIAALAYGTETVPRVDKITDQETDTSPPPRSWLWCVGIDSMPGPPR